MKNKKMNYSQISGIIPAVPTPFSEDGQLNLDGLRFNLNRLGEEPLSGYLIGGSNGEFVYLSAEERVQVVTTAREVIPEDRVLIVGTGMESTRSTIAMTKMMAEAGAEVAIVVCPNYFTNKMTTDALVKHYSSVADASPIPILLYSVPANTGFDLPIEAVVRLAPHENIIGMKDSGGNITRIGSLVLKTPDDFSMMAGSGGFYLAALAVGCVGTICALANIAARQLALIQEYFDQADLINARATQLRLIEPNTILTVKLGVPGLKNAMDMLGFKGGTARPPLLPLSDDEKDEVRRVLEESDLFD